MVVGVGVGTQFETLVPTPSPLSDGHYLLDNLGASQSRAPNYSMPGSYASTKAELSGTGVPGWYH